jgi:hypothetical protein
MADKSTSSKATLKSKLPTKTETDPKTKLPAVTTDPWSDQETEMPHGVKEEVAGATSHLSFDDQAVSLAKELYSNFRAACLGCKKRGDLWRLWQGLNASKFPSLDEDGLKELFSKVLFALAKHPELHQVHVVRAKNPDGSVGKGHILLWKANAHHHHDKPRYQSDRPSKPYTRREHDGSRQQSDRPHYKTDRQHYQSDRPSKPHYQQHSRRQHDDREYRPKTKRDDTQSELEQLRASQLELTKMVAALAAATTKQ